MAVYITEHAGTAGAAFRQLMSGPPLAAYSVSSLSTANFPSAGCSYIRVSADAPSLLNISATSTGVALTSTNAIRIAANVNPERFAVSTTFRIQVAST